MLLEHMVPQIEKTGANLYDMAVYEDGKIQAHRFQPGSNCHNCYSVAKAFMMTAVGILQSDGLLDVKKPIKCYLSALMPKDIDPAWQLVTVEDALKHRIGYGEGFLDIDVEDVNAYPSDDYLNMVFRHPLRYLPGQKMVYTDGAFYLISRIVSCVAGERADAFLNRRLFQPLKFHEVAWSVCPKNYPMGATGLYISTYDMIKLAILYIDGGLWEGKRILSEDWVKRAIANEYELCIRSPSGMIGKAGMYGQMLMFDRARKLAIAWHGHTENRESVQRLIDCVGEALGITTR